MKLFIFLITLILSACGPKVYQADIPQGNILTLAQINQIKENMTQAQVVDLLGSPSIVDAFHNKRWDYINFSTLPNSQDKHYHITLFFDDKDKLIKIEKKNIQQIIDTEKNKKMGNREDSIERKEQEQVVDEPWYKIW